MARHFQPISDVLPDFGFCYGVPCYMGIIPYVTTWEEALRIFASRPDLTISQRPNTVEVANGPIESISAYWERKNGIIFEVSVRIRADVLRVEKIITEMGTPCAVYPVPSPNMSRPYLMRLSYSYWFVW